MKIIAASFPSKNRAPEVLADLGDADINWGIPFDQAAVAVTRNKHGKIRVHQSHEAASAGAFFGGLAGFTFGALLLSPVLGATLGAATGAAIGSTGDPIPLDGIDKDFLKQLGTRLPNNSSAVMMIVPDTVGDVAAKAIRAYDDGVLFQTAIDAVTEDAIQKAFDNRTKA